MRDNVVLTLTERKRIPASIETAVLMRSARRSFHVHDLGGSNVLNRIQERWKDGAVIFDPAPLRVNTDDPERQFLEVDLEFRAAIDRNENIKLSPRLGGQLSVGQC